MHTSHAFPLLGSMVGGELRWQKNLISYHGIQKIFKYNFTFTFTFILSCSSIITFLIFISCSISPHSTLLVIIIIINCPGGILGFRTTALFRSGSHWWGTDREMAGERTSTPLRPNTPAFNPGVTWHFAEDTGSGSVTVPYFSPVGNCSSADYLSLDVSCLAGEEANISAARPASVGAGVDGGPPDGRPLSVHRPAGAGGAAGMGEPRVDPQGGPLSSPALNTARVALGSRDDLGPSGPNWIARVGGNLSFSSVDGFESIPEGAPSASLPPGAGSKRRRRRERRRLTQQMSSVSL